MGLAIEATMAEGTIFPDIAGFLALSEIV